MRTSLLALLVAISLTVPLLAIAGDDIPDLKGTWTGKFSSIKYGKGDPKAHIAEKDLGKLSSMDFTLIIDFQEGRVFSGTQASAKNKERIVGVIRSDNKRICITDEDSFFFAELLAPDKLEIVWMEVQSPVHAVGHAVYTKK